MPTFTPVTHGFAPQLQMQELIEGINERRDAAYASRATALEDDRLEDLPNELNSLALQHAAAQKLLEKMVPYFVNYVAGMTPADDSSNIAPWPRHTLATWRAAAGLPPGGFRRATVWSDPTAPPAFSYGRIETGDIAGYWIWEDLIKGMRALKYTDMEAGGWDAERKVYQGPGFTTLAAAIADGDAGLQGATWKATGGKRHTWVRCVQNPNVGSTWAHPVGEIYRSKLGVGFMEATPTACKVEISIRPDQGDYGASPYQPTYYDPEGLLEKKWLTWQFQMSPYITPKGSMKAVCPAWSYTHLSATPFADSVTTIGYDLPAFDPGWCGSSTATHAMIEWIWKWS